MKKSELRKIIRGVIKEQMRKSPKSNMRKGGGPTVKPAAGKDQFRPHGLPGAPGVLEIGPNDRCQSYKNFKVPSTHPLTGDLGYGNWQDIDCEIWENPQFDSYWGSTNPISGNQPNNIMWCCDNYTSCDDFHNPNANTLGIDNVSPID